MSAGISLISILIIIANAVLETHGGCQFKKDWQGRWFQSGIQSLLKINNTHIDMKGECYEEQGDKFLVYDKSDDCYRCMVVHVKHLSVLQYKETYCEPKASLQSICDGITGDAALYSMFKKYPQEKPVPCPFKSAPFTFSYNRGTGDCNNPPSKADSCTDDSRLVLKYQACPDVPATESNVEELTCLATWKEGSTRYLIGRLAQGDRRSVVSDEAQYRCFIYQRGSENGKTYYNVAQSGDATCTGLQNALEGSRIMKLTTVDNHHFRCKFPVWITDHHTWLSLDHHKTYKFSQKNATLKILDDEPQKAKIPSLKQTFPQNFPPQESAFESQNQRKQNSEMRVICHSILPQAKENSKMVQIVAHVTSGCDSGYICMIFHKRDSNVIEIQQTEKYVENPDEACQDFDFKNTPYLTLLTTTLHTQKCPNLGRYTIASNHMESKKRKRRQQSVKNSRNVEPDCISHDYEAISMGCSETNQIEFRSSCQQSISAYSCHGSWEENGVSYVITSPVTKKVTDSLRYCLIYTKTNEPESVTEGKSTGMPTLHLSAVSQSCYRHIVPGVSGNWAFNFISNGTCAQKGDTNTCPVFLPSFLLTLTTFLVVFIIR